jgi:hypothetical protein
VTETTKSKRITGNDEASGIDPGGTHPTKPGQRDKSKPTPGAGGSVKLEQTVESGDRNTRRGPRDR